ncbi:MAG: sensor protein KdpD, partial [Bacteroidales bacterium]
GIEVTECIPDSILQQADEIVNIDLTADELIARLKAGKIYSPEKIGLALSNFFKTENILQLRELALKEVALRVEKQIENEVHNDGIGVRHERLLACIDSQEKKPRHIIRKAARLATRYNISFTTLYVQTPAESPDKISLVRQRYLLNHFKLVAELGGEVVRIQSRDILGTILEVCKQRQITILYLGTPRLPLPRSLFKIFAYRKFLKEIAKANIDLIVVS